MKIFNFKVSVQLNEIGDLSDLPPPTAADRMMDKWMSKINGPGRGPVVLGVPYPGEGNGASISRNFSILAESLEDAQRQLAKFQTLSKEIHDSAPADTLAKAAQSFG